MLDFNALHNLTPDDVVFVYNTNVADSLSVAEHYRQQRGIPAKNMIGLDMPVPAVNGTSCELPISKSDFEDRIRTPLRKRIRSLQDSIFDSGAIGSGETIECSVIILGFGTPLSYTEDDGEIIAIASRLHRIHHNYEQKRTNHTFDRRGDWQFYNTTDSSVVCLTAIIDGPTAAAAKKLIDRSIDVSRQSFITGKLYIDPFGNKLTTPQVEYEDIILDFIDNEVPNLGLTSVVTVDTDDPYTEPTISRLDNDSFYWGWFSPTFSKDLFLNQNERRVFLYNADDDSACKIHFFTTGSAFEINGSDPWCNLAINVEPGYASTAGAVDAPTEEGYLRPRPFFEALHRGSSLAEAFLFSSRFVNWKMVLIGDPLMTVAFKQPLPSDQDISNVLVGNNEVILQVKESLEEGLAYGARQERLTQDIIDKNVLSSEFSEELNLLYAATKWNTLKKQQVHNQLFSQPTLAWLNYIQQTTGLTLGEWLDSKNERISEFLRDVINLIPNDSTNLTTDHIYPQGHWQFDFQYLHPRQTLENVHFEIQIASDSAFASLLIDTGTLTSIIGWKQEQEPLVFTSLIETGFPSNLSGRRIRYEQSSGLVRTEVYFVRWRAVDTNGVPITGYQTSTKQLIVKR